MKMKKVLFLLAVSCVAGNLQAQEIRDAKNNVVNYIDIHATSLLNKDKETVCIFRQDGRIVDTKSNTLGFIVGGHEIQDKNHKVLGHITGNGLMEDANNKPVGTVNINGTGPVMDKNNNVIGFTDKVEPMWAAAYYLLLKKQL